MQEVLDVSDLSFCLGALSIGLRGLQMAGGRLQAHLPLFCEMCQRRQFAIGKLLPLREIRAGLDKGA